jgi:type IV secretion system protein VirD4
MGNQTVVTHEATATGSKPHSTARPLVTADEVRRGSHKYIFTFVEQRPPTYFAKLPYYEMPALYNAYDDNPYYTPEADDSK